MGTNYYRIPTAEEMEERRTRLQAKIIGLKLTPDLIERNFAYIEDPNDQWTRLSPWDEFLDGANVHLGKRSGGWKFLWNWNHRKYYKTKEDLLSFIQSGRVVNEYGDEFPQEEFIEMALSWGQEDGLDIESYHRENPDARRIWANEKHEEYIDGLRVSTSTEFS
jgi:hypothetical protein